MNNDLLDNIDKKNTILNYQIINNDIVINYVLRFQVKIPYTIENEKRILNDIKRQVLNSNEFRRKQKERLSRLYNKALISIILFFSSSSLLAHTSPKNHTFMETVMAYSVVSTVIILYQIVNTKKSLMEEETIQEVNIRNINQMKKSEDSSYLDTPKVFIKNKLEK